MDSRSAEDHLRVIRELMERATIYRTISAPAALFCGFLALFVAFAALIRGPLQPILRHSFVQVWIIVFLLSAVANTLFLLGSSKERKEAFPSTLRDGSFIDGNLCPAFDRGARLGVCAHELSWPWLVDARLSLCFYG